MTVSNNNQIISVDVVIYNQSAKTATNVVTVITLSEGLEYISYILPNGVFNPNTLTWTLYQLQPNTAKQLTLKLKVKDINKAPFTVTQKVTANEKDINMSNNCKTIVIERSDCTTSDCAPGTPSNPTVILNDFNYSSVNLNLSSINNVRCGCCITRYEIVSTDNFEVDYLGSQLGDLRGHPIDAKFDWSFDYTVSCTNCPDSQQFTFGPKTVSGSGVTSGVSNKIEKVLLNSNNSTPIGAGYGVYKIRINPSSPSSVRVGLTPGGIEVLPITPITPGWSTFIVNVFDTNSYTLYVDGIISSTQIIIYYE